MALLLSNAVLTTTREGGTPILSAVRAKTTPARLVFSPAGPQRVQTVLIDPGQDVVAGDYLSLTMASGAVRTGKATFVDQPEGGALAYLVITVVGGLLPA